MTREESRLILDAHTLTGGEAGEDDSGLREALEMQSQDPALADWFAKRRAADQRIAELLADVPIPDGLRDRLLKIEKAPSSTLWRRRSGALLAIAAMLILGGVWLAWPPTGHDEGGMPGWQTASLKEVAQVDSGSLPLDHLTPNLADIKAFLTKAGSPIPGELPKNLVANKNIGCKMFTVDGHRAAVVCFEIAPGVAAHLVVLDVAPSVSGVEIGHPRFAGHNHWQMACWSDGKMTYMLGTRAGMEQLKHLFA